MSAVPRAVRDSMSVSAGDAPESGGPADVNGSARLPRTRADTAWVLACLAAVALLV